MLPKGDIYQLSYVGAILVYYCKLKFEGGKFNMKVKELIKVLSKVDNELEVVGTWESICNPIQAITVIENPLQNTLFLHVDDSFYEDRLLEGEQVIYKKGDVC